MKRNSLKILIIFALFIFSCTGANAACSWEEQKTYFDNAKGAHGEVVTTDCSSGKVLNNDTSCTGTKPTYPAQDGVSSKTICCCSNNNSNTTTTADPKFKLPDYAFQIPIGKLSKLNTVDCSSGSCQIPFISQYISAIYDYGLSVAGVFGVLMLMAAGLLWIVSGGDSGKITKAKQLIVGSITGLLLLVGLNLFLSYINPDLIRNGSIQLENIERIDVLTKLADSRNGGDATSFKNSGCATDEQLTTGVDFYATGYYKPAYTGDANFFCVVAMQCSCPGGTDSTKVCDIYKNTYPNYHPCKDFSSNTPYCNMTSSGSIPQIGDIAGPDCSNLKAGTYVCFKNKTYKITDRGGGIKGKRIDIWSGDNINQAYANTGVGKLTIGACK